MEKPIIFYLDFDGTVARQDVGLTMVKTFAGEGWRAINRRWEEGVLTTAECARQTLDIMPVGPEELQNFFMGMPLTPGFADFMAWTRENQYDLYILSDGYANYIELILNREGLNIPYFANYLQWKNGWRIETPYADDECPRCGVCKSAIIKEKSTAGCLKVYVGDGYSDLCPARICDIVFAKDALAQLCQKENIFYYRYTDFYDVTQVMQEIIELMKEGKINEQI